MMDENGLKIKTKWFEASGKKVVELIAVLCLTLLSVMAYAFMEHKHDAQQASVLLAAAIKEMTLAQKQNVEAQREMNCLIALSQEKREREYMSPNSLCKQLARER